MRVTSYVVCATATIQGRPAEWKEKVKFDPIKGHGAMWADANYMFKIMKEQWAQYPDLMIRIDPVFNEDLKLELIV